MAAKSFKNMGSSSIRAVVCREKTWLLEEESREVFF